MEGATIYHFRVSAGVLVGETLNEGELSALNPSAIVHIPETGKFIPPSYHCIPQNLYW